MTGVQTCALPIYVPHPDIEVLLTMSEETGMEGAVGLRPGL